MTKEIKVLNYLGFKNDVTEEVHEAIKQKGTYVAKYVNQRMNRAKTDTQYIILTSDTQFTVFTDQLVTQKEIQQFSLILGLEYIKAGTAADENGLWLAYIGDEELPTEETPSVDFVNNDVYNKECNNKYNKRELLKMKKLQGVVFESKAWEIQVDEGMVFVINKRFESEGRYEACTEVTSDMVESFEIKGVKVPKYLREELALLFHEMEALEKQETEMEFVGIESVWFFKGEPERNVRLYKDQYGMFVSYKYRESGIRFMCVKEGVHGGLFITFDPHELSKYRDGRSTLEEYKATLELDAEEKEIIELAEKADELETNEQYILKKMKNETFETLTKRGRGVELEQWCIWLDLSEYGTAQEKAERLLEWYKEQTEEAPEFETPLEGLVAERPYQALLEMAINKNPILYPDNKVIRVLIKQEDLSLYLRALGHLGVQYCGHCITAGNYEVIHERVEKPFEEEVEEMLQKREQELTVTDRQNTTLVMMPHAHFSLIIGKRYTVHYKDAHDEYELADMLYLGHGVQNDVLFFGDSFENILHVDPFKITALWTDILKQT